MAERRDWTPQGPMRQSGMPDVIVAVRNHSPHQLSMIEEASRETLSTLAAGDVDHTTNDIHQADMYVESSGLLEEHMEQSFNLKGFDDTISNVGPHAHHHRGLTQNTVETVLYGNWEQDNNLDDLNRCSSTVIHYDLDGTGLCDVACSSSSVSSFQPSAKKETARRGANIDSGTRTKDWSMFRSSLVDYGPDEPSPRLPGCSAGHPYKTTWKLSDSAMVAYNAMRGPTMLPGNDPLRNWMVVKANEAMEQSMSESLKQTRSTCPTADGAGDVDEQSPSSSTGKKTASTTRDNSTTSPSVLGSQEKQGSEDYAKMLKEANMAAREYGPTDMKRKPVFEVPRPRYIHISPRFKTFKFEDYITPEVTVPESNYKQPFDPKREFEEEYEISDDEGDPQSGRISPCTFRLLAEGCSEGDPKANQVSIAEDAERMRPSTPVDDSDTCIAPDRLAIAFELQKDVDDGGWITPCYAVESEPSIIYTPPGVTLKHKMRNWWFGLFDRMDPIAARRFHRIQFREANDPVTPLETASERSVFSSSSLSDGASSKQGKPYTEAEVLEALHSPASRRVAGIDPKNAQLIISQRWQTVTRWKAQDTELVRENDSMRSAIERARIELREIRLTVDHLLRKKAAEEMAMRQRRHKGILRQVSAHLHELRYEIQSKFDALKAAQTQNQTMRAELALLEWQIKNECARAEMTTPDEVRKAVSQHFRDKMAALNLEECF